MERGELPAEETNVRSHAAWMAAVAVLAFAVVQAGRGGPHTGAATLARLVWAAGLLVTAAALRRAGDRAAGIITAIAAPASVAALGVLSWAEYGFGYSGAFLVCAPLFVAVLLPERFPVVVASGAASVAAVTIIETLLHEPSAVRAELAVRAAGAAAFAVVGCRVHAQIVRAARAAADVRARALAELRESEAQRARVEALAEAGTRSAAVAHAMSSPLAAVRANLDFLQDALAAAPDAAALAEAREAIAETRVCAERLADDLAALRAAGLRPETPTPVASAADARSDPAGE